jgi:hypothetical protein
MAHATEFAIGATASCPDGMRGGVSRVIVDPATRTVTHLVIGPKHRREPGRLFPLHLVDATAGDESPGRARLWRGAVDEGLGNIGEAEAVVEGAGCCFSSTCLVAEVGR